MDIKRRINAVLYQYQDKFTGYGVKLTNFYLIEGELEHIIKNELRECYKDVKRIDGNYSEAEFEAWYNYKYNTKTI